MFLFSFSCWHDWIWDKTSWDSSSNRPCLVFRVGILFRCCLSLALRFSFSRRFFSRPQQRHFHSEVHILKALNLIYIKDTRVFPRPHSLTPHLETNEAEVPTVGLLEGGEDAGECHLDQQSFLWSAWGCIHLRCTSWGFSHPCGKGFIPKFDHDTLKGDSDAVCCQQTCELHKCSGHYACDSGDLR